MKIEMWDVNRPKPYDKNPRKITQKAIEKVAASIKSFGFRQSIVVDKNETIVVGHTRLAASKFLGLTQVPVHVAHDLTAAQIRAYRLADNRLNEESEWDLDLLSVEFGELKLMDLDLALTGFDLLELEQFFDGSIPSPEFKQFDENSANDVKFHECPECRHKWPA